MNTSRTISSSYLNQLEDEIDGLNTALKYALFNLREAFMAGATRQTNWESFVREHFADIFDKEIENEDTETDHSGDE
jgi:hypothetical protein